MTMILVEGARTRARTRSIRIRIRIRIRAQRRPAVTRPTRTRRHRPWKRGRPCPGLSVPPFQQQVVQTEMRVAASLPSC